MPLAAARRQRSRRPGAGAAAEAVSGCRAPSCAHRAAGPQGAGDRGAGRAAPALQSPPRLQRVWWRCCRWVLSLRQGLLPETQNVRQPCHKSSPLRAVRPHFSSLHRDRSPTGSLGVPAALCPASQHAPKENSTVLLCGCCQGIIPNWTSPCRPGSSSAGWSLPHCKAQTRVPKPQWEETGIVNLVRGSRQSQAPYSHQHSTRPPQSLQTMRRQSLILAVSLPKLPAALLTISTGARQQWKSQ